LLPAPARWAAKAVRLFAGRESREGRPGERLARALERMGPAAIKLGQLLSTRGDMLSATFAQDLGGLKDRLAPFATQTARAEVAKALGPAAGELFAEFGEPIAAASLAQAHEARLARGEPVAVKVLRPGIEAAVRADIRALSLAAGMVETWVPAARRLRPRAFAATVARSLELELDLRIEAAGADELGQVMAADGYMTAPKVVWEGVARRVLTLEWAQGAPLSDPAVLDDPRLDRPALAKALTRAFLCQALDHGAFLCQALDHGVFHADLHEGNLFVAPPAQLTAVDFGIVGRLGTTERRYLAEILWGFLRRDYARIAAVHFEAGYVPASQDAGEFAQALRAVGEPVFGRRAGALSMGRLLTQLFEVTARFDMALRPELVLLQKTMVTVEGVARRIDPDHDLWAAAEPVVRRWITRELGPAAQLANLMAQFRATLAVVARQAGHSGATPVAVAPDALELTAPPDPRAQARWGLAALWLAFAAGVALTAAVFAAAAWFR
jgi:ubiquinone biosynthesis protein